MKVCIRSVDPSAGTISPSAWAWCAKMSLATSQAGTTVAIASPPLGYSNLGRSRASSSCGTCGCSCTSALT